MTNKEKLSQYSLAGLLNMLNDKSLTANYICIMDCLDYGHECVQHMDEIISPKRSICNRCISNWLNETAKED